MKSIHDILDKPPIFKFEGFIIRPLDGWNVWFEHPDGSGTSLRKAVLLGWLKRLFEETI